MEGPLVPERYFANLTSPCVVSPLKASPMFARAGSLRGGPFS